MGIVIVCHRRYDHLKRCLQSIVEASRFATRLRIEVLVNLNPWEEPLENLVAQFQSRSEGIQWHLHSTEKSLPAPIARNILLERHPDLDWYLFIDDDAFYDSQYFKEFEKCIFSHKDFGLFGGPNLLPPGSQGVEVASDWFLQSRFCGPFRKRYSREPAHGESGDSSLILCNLAVRKNPQLWFDAQLPLGEENDLIYRHQQIGEKAYYCANLIVYHHRRDDMIMFLRQLFKYGLGRGFVSQRHHRTFLVAAMVGLLFWTMILILFFPFAILWLLLTKKNSRKVAPGTYGALPIWGSWIYFIGVFWGFFNHKNRDQI